MTASADADEGQVRRRFVRGQPGLERLSDDGGLGGALEMRHSIQSFQQVTLEENRRPLGCHMTAYMRYWRDPVKPWHDPAVTSNRSRCPARTAARSASAIARTQPRQEAASDPLRAQPPDPWPGGPAALRPRCGRAPSSRAPPN